MFSKISWGQYIEASAAILTLYYGCVLVVFRKGSESLSPKTSSPRKWKVDVSVEEPSVGNSDEVAGELLLSAVHELMEELSRLFRQASERKYSRAELLMALQLQLKAYSRLKGTGFQQSVDSHIVEQAAHACGIALEQREVKLLWTAAHSPN